MKKKLRNLMVCLAAMFMAGTFQLAEASHYQGTEMTYAAIGPGIYRVNMKIYRDCSGASAPSSVSLNLKSQGCNNGRNVTMTQIGSNRIGDPYCPQLPKTCNAGLYTNYEEVIFAATVTLTASEQTCPDWIFSWSECCRPATANLQGTGTMYTEAFVKLFTPNTAGQVPANIVHNNNSPEFGPFDVVVPFVNAYMPITVSTYAMDTDNDSLVYTLETPLDNSTTAVPYINFGAQVINDPDPNSTKVASTPAGTFSATFPMHSFNVDWTQANPVATPYFNLNAQNGSLTFTPTAYFPNTPSAQGLNKYVIVVKIDEWRTINGQPVKIGTIRRDMFITIMDCGPNANPRVANPVANGQPITPNTIITLRPGTPLNLTLLADDNNTADILNMTSDAASILPGANFSVSPGNRPSATLVWIPTASHVRSQIYYFRVTVQDNACPVRGVQMQTFGVRVSNTGNVTGTKDNLSKDLSFVAYPNPYRETVSFKVNVTNAAQEVLIYNVLGQQVDKISLKGFKTGEQHVVWTKGAKQAPGQYIAKLISGREILQSIQFTKMP